MGLLDRVRSMFGNGSASATAPGRFECPHKTMTPQWNDAADEGDESKAASFVCASCHSELTPQQAGWARKRGTEGSRR